MNVHSFAKRKMDKQKISMVTCYDHWSAKILNQTDIDCILVGDSLAVVMHGFDSTVYATTEMMELHVSAVARGARDKFIVADMPFLSCSKGMEVAMDTVHRLMSAGANAVKIEGDTHQVELIRHIIEAGVPVMGHLGLMPQSIHSLGGHKVQAKDEAKASKLIASAKALQQAGCFAVVLECIPTKLGSCVSQRIDIPTIGIGAGPHTDGQVLVLHDLLGVNPEFSPKFLRRYSDSYGVIHAAVNNFHSDVVEQAFPSLQESYR
ncbi:MAG: 3-methyl-2-oxobutanoate hydroxymethyltransferase [bacterium]|nr:3-methyl-2-oxobutanoate hydroxymethyltransferase [Gammaproteobacteria bacterium]HIL96973.1 3-methyl-2-oxobutanoate hydroxymethyltransferase [Pseudomonadales bacterium]